MVDDDDVLSQVRGINDIIAELVSDIKRNKTEDNKDKLSKIAKELRIIKKKLTDIYSPKTTQSTLNFK